MARRSASDRGATAVPCGWSPSARPPSGPPPQPGCTKSTGSGASAAGARRGRRGGLARGGAPSGAA
eukprot:914902-Alexandrium_andersonii.AAC.1